MILANGCNITKSEKFKGVWILSVPTVYTVYIKDVKVLNTLIWRFNMKIYFWLQILMLDNIND